MMALPASSLQRLRGQLEQRRRDLEAEIRADARRIRGDNPASLSGAPPDAGEASIDDLIADVDSAELQRDAGELRQVRDALDRIASGTYGVCIDCGRDIPLARLEAQPFAPRCVECQAAWERAHPGSGGATL
jgi:RNA polymerase-binding transcription factor DksA